MPVTLIDMAEQAFNRGEERTAEVIMNFAQESRIMRFLSFRTIAGNALTFPREQRLPNVGFRGINEGYSEDAGEVTSISESTKIIGGDMDVDKSLVRSMGEEIRRSREQMKIRALTLSWERSFIKGDTSSDPRGLDGLQKRCTGTQLIPAGTTSGGDPLSLNTLDRAKKRTRMPTHWIMSQDMALRLTASARDMGVSGYINYTLDEFGQEVTMYAGLPIIELEEDNEAQLILPFTEENPGGGTPASTSIYCVSFGDMRLEGIQNTDIEVNDLGELETKPCYRTRVEWEAGIAVMDARSITRIWGIADVPVVA